MVLARSSALHHVPVLQPVDSNNSFTRLSDRKIATLVLDFFYVQNYHNCPQHAVLMLLLGQKISKWAHSNSLDTGCLLPAEEQLRSLLPQTWCPSTSHQLLQVSCYCSYKNKQTKKLHRNWLQMLFRSWRRWRSWSRSQSARSPTCYQWRDFSLSRWEAGDHGGQTLPSSADTWAATSCSSNCVYPAWCSCDCICTFCAPPTGTASSPHWGTDEGKDLFCSLTLNLF